MNEDDFSLHKLSLEDPPNYFRRQLALKRRLQAEQQSTLKSQSPPPVFTSFSNDEDDSMDIDEDFSLKEIGDDHSSVDNLVQFEKVGSSNRAAKINDDDNDNESDAENDADASTSSIIVHNILSPTSIGARLAIRKPRLLLMGPEDGAHSEIPTTDHSMDLTMEEDEDEEVLDTETHGTVLGRNPGHDWSQFQGANSTGNDRLEYYYNPQSHTYEAYAAPQPPPLQLSRAKSYPSVPFGGIQGSSIQIHHHHYYGGSSLENVNQTKQAVENTLRWNSQVVPVDNGMKNVTEKEHLQVQIELQQNQLQRHQQRQQLLEVALPLPWEQRLVPRDHIPYVILSYLQLVMNVIFVLYGLHLVYGIVSSIKQDIGERLKRHRTNVLVEIASCRRSWYENQCEPDTIVPALEEACQYWLKCMEQDVDGGIGQISIISAETIGLVLNLFVEPLGIKFYGVLLLIGITMFGCNIGFGFIRAKTYYGWQPQHQKN